MTDTEVLVVGGGPIGLACAIEARMAGRDVVVLEPREAPVDKACGEGLMPGAVRALGRLGVEAMGHPLTGISYRAGGRHADHAFHDGTGRGVRRTSLHTALRERAVALGATSMAGRVTDVQVGADSVRAGGITARWLLGCDGLHSTVRRLCGLQAEPPRRTRRRFGLRRHYPVPPWSDLVEVHWSPTVEAYVTPIANDLVSVALLGPPASDLDGALNTLPELTERLGRADAGPVRGAGPLRQATSARTSGRVRLVGDASGYVDALTGEGLRVGLAQARAVVELLDDPAGYERAWVAVTRDYRVLTSALVRWATSPARPAIVPVARGAPWLYGAVVERLAR